MRASGLRNARCLRSLSSGSNSFSLPGVPLNITQRQKMIRSCHLYFLLSLTVLKSNMTAISSSSLVDRCAECMAVPITM